MTDNSRLKTTNLSAAPCWVQEAACQIFKMLPEGWTVTTVVRDEYDNYRLVVADDTGRHLLTLPVW
jgi:hypothetical protein